MSSSSSRDYYKRQPLPSIRDVLGDQLDRPPRGDHDDAYSVDAMQRALPSPGAPTRSRSTWPPTTGPTLPPIHAHAHGYATAPSPPHPHPHPHPHHSSHPHTPSSHHPHPHTHTHHTHHAPPTQPYSFDVFRTSSAGLIHESSSHRSQGIIRTTRADAGKRHTSSASASSPHYPQHEYDERAGVGMLDDEGGSEKKYACPMCGKRFGRPSSLKTHEVVHSEEKPYECPHPGCGKTFTVPSNMRRHFRKAHEGGGAGGGAGGASDEDDAYAAHPSSSSYGGGGGGGGFYTSSRR